MHGAPALAAGFTHLPHVNPDAPKGGLFRLGAPGTFDNLNPFTIKGNTPQGLREYVYEGLLARSGSEPFSLYGLIAASVETPPDRSSVTFRLRPEARFSDGKPITADDVVFSHSVLSQKGWPYQQSHYRKVARVDIVDPHTVRFVFKPQGDRELPLIIGLMPVLPRHRLSADTIERTTLEPPAGSGPYTVSKVDTGRSLTFQRDPNYWGRDLPIQRGRFNFNTITIEYFRDQGTMFEAFKSGDLDARLEDDPGRWAEGYDFPAMRQGLAARREMQIGQPAGMSAIVFNTRRAPFDDQRVRRAFALLFDADWINKSLYHGLYRRTESFFSRSDLASNGRPADARERELLAKFPGTVRPEVLEGRTALPTGDGVGGNRAELKEANQLLAEAGYTLDNGRLVHLKTGRPLAFEFLGSSRTQERLILAYADNLRRLGIQLRLRQVDSAQYWSRMKSYDFDVSQWNWTASLSPGNEQINRWSSRAAATQGTFNYAGVANPAADAMIEALLQSETREGFTSAVRALDRVLLSGDYVVPLFHMPGQWLAWRTRVAFPEKPPLTGIDFDTWWAVK
jgi:peptide/nickel transport system substrate-binding protein